MLHSVCNSYIFLMRVWSFLDNFRKKIKIKFLSIYSHEYFNLMIFRQRQPDEKAIYIYLQKNSNSCITARKNLFSFFIMINYREMKFIYQNLHKTPIGEIHLQYSRRDIFDLTTKNISGMTRIRIRFTIRP